MKEKLLNLHEAMKTQIDSDEEGEYYSNHLAIQPKYFSGDNLPKLDHNMLSRGIMLQETLDLRAEDEIKNLQITDRNPTWTQFRTEDHSYNDVGIINMSPIDKQNKNLHGVINHHDDDIPEPSRILISQQEQDSLMLENIEKRKKTNLNGSDVKLNAKVIQQKETSNFNYTGNPKILDTLQISGTFDSHTDSLVLVNKSSYVSSGYIKNIERNLIDDTAMKREMSLQTENVPLSQCEIDDGQIFSTKMQFLSPEKSIHQDQLQNVSLLRKSLGQIQNSIIQHNNFKKSQLQNAQYNLVQINLILSPKKYSDQKINSDNNFELKKSKAYGKLDFKDSPYLSTDKNKINKESRRLKQANDDLEYLNPLESNFQSRDCAESVEKDDKRRDDEKDNKGGSDNKMKRETYI